MKNYLMEFIGTFFLVMVVGMSVIGPGGAMLAPIAIGSVLMVMVYAGGHISGGHYNPAVTLAVWMRGKCPTKDIVPYWVAQMVAGIIAALLVNRYESGMVVSTMEPHMLRALLNEFLFTFALCFVVLSVVTNPKTAGNSYFGLAIGFTLAVGVAAGGHISGGAYNPAVALGITIMGLSSPAWIWIFIVGNLLGGAAAAIVYKFLNPE